ncbi:hypothetical protein DPMN_151116 [Dreissena polymorpha]|uniref:Uncharacterized protein n=1 Tax=Dreissena polymorpha TaxID=45954 RepID=A0A9D4FJA4_DREPO|nr:hypothetical protein DPMN_151116 [Dreissena polymorpha]
MWMHSEAVRLELSSEAMCGGIIFDEMAIHEDLQECKNGDVIQLVGFEDVGHEAKVCNVIKDGKTEKK